MKRTISLLLTLLLVFSTSAVFVEAGTTQTVENSVLLDARWTTGSYGDGDLAGTTLLMILSKDQETGEEYFDVYIEHYTPLGYNEDIGWYEWTFDWYYGRVPRSALSSMQKRNVTARIVAEGAMFDTYDNAAGEYITVPIDIDLTFVSGATTVTATTSKDKTGSMILTTREYDYQHYGTTSGTLAVYSVTGEPFQNPSDNPNTNDTLSMHTRIQTITSTK